MIAKCKLQNPKKKAESIVLVYHDGVEDNIGLMKDLEEKYLPSITTKENIQPRRFQQFCKGTFEFSMRKK